MPFPYFDNCLAFIFQIFWSKTDSYYELKYYDKNYKRHNYYLTDINTLSEHTLIKSTPEHDLKSPTTTDLK